MLLALVGGQVWTRAGRQLSIATEARLERLALMTPATDFFQVPGALDAIHVPILALAGSKDVITPPVQAEFLKQAIGAPVEVCLVEGAGHFSFMDDPPPQMTDPLGDRDAFLARLAEQVCRFVTR